MNITDVDDKVVLPWLQLGHINSLLNQIIAGARRQHLLSWYQSQYSEGQLSAERVLSDIDEAMLVSMSLCSHELT